MNALNTIANIIFFTFITLNISANETVFDCNSAVEDYSEEAMKVIASGFTVGDSTKCLNDQKQFKYFSIKTGDTYEGRSSKLTKIQSDSKITILSKKTNELGFVKLEFEIENKDKKYKDSFSYFKNNNGEVKDTGCFMFDELPKLNYIYTNCVK